MSEPLKKKQKTESVEVIPNKQQEYKKTHAFVCRSQDPILETHYFYEKSTKDAKKILDTLSVFLDFPVEEGQHCLPTIFQFLLEKSNTDLTNEKLYPKLHNIEQKIKVIIKDLEEKSDDSGELLEELLTLDVGKWTCGEIESHNGLSKPLNFSIYSDFI
jgi:hypothetical protein